MNREEIVQKAFEYFNGGFHCAEAVSKAIVEVYGKGPNSEIPQVASAFGGGAVKTFDGTCGALTGGLVAIGCLYGRMKPGDEETKKEVFQLAQDLGKRFVAEFGASNCNSVLELLGPQENMNKCKQLSGTVAGMLSDILEKKTKAS
ncbi:MAG: C-GCAxxG-C-C family protein [Proteobacteria bacterium]|nr:C-GCAxxG-C-C family protein [Pseudomonadota bacterium]MBU2453310.1 C-GCAxxG-C-C family protein [Pseudomonadota bacterium]MBU2629543.1 C-GCAxxG-C-C family protein [Pseudomonadota bacterium]